MAHQTLSLEKYWKLFSATLKETETKPLILTASYYKVSHQIPTILKCSDWCYMQAVENFTPINHFCLF